MPNSNWRQQLIQAVQKQQESPLASISRERIHHLVERWIAYLFPHYDQSFCLISRPVGIEQRDQTYLECELQKLQDMMSEILQALSSQLKQSPEATAQAWFEQLPQLYAQMKQDAESLYLGDPAATSVDEVILSYPGFLAVAVYRLAHALHQLGVPVIPRMMTEYAHHETGIDIHPGAKIGSAFCIDHGTGIVIGETAEIGNHVKLYQGVTLGALSVAKDMAQTKRHPSIEDHVIIYAGATILGGETVIGHNSIIGGNVWLTHSVEPFSQVYHQSNLKVRSTAGSNGS